MEPPTLVRKMKGIHPTDRVVGDQIRLQRLVKGLSQSQLAAAIGVTFQQLQKYEKGTNRVSASRLSEIAKKLDVSVGALFGEQPSAVASAMGNFDLTKMTRTDLLIARALLAIPDAPFKSSILSFLRTVGSRDENAKQDDPDT